MRLPGRRQCWSQHLTGIGIRGRGRSMKARDLDGLASRLGPLERVVEGIWCHVRRCRGDCTELGGVGLLLWQRDVVGGRRCACRRGHRLTGRLGRWLARPDGRGQLGIDALKIVTAESVP
jgi:hypothetical protein